MCVVENSSSDINWVSKDPSGKTWFNAKFSLYDFKAVESSDDLLSKRITQLLKACARQDSEFLSQWKGQKVEMKLEFEREWGLGTSSTLVYCMAEWADVNAYQLVMDTFGGSGYDIACAGADGPILYSLIDYAIEIEQADFKPKFADKLYFVYLGQKQDSQTEVSKYKSGAKDHKLEIKEITSITENTENCNNYDDFVKLMLEHEAILSKILKRKRIQDERFPDFKGTIKSLGAWGGDFILVMSELPEKELKEYFNQKGLNVVFKYEDLVLKRKG